FVFIPAGHAPRAPDVEHPGLSVELGFRERRLRIAEYRQREIGRRPSDEHRLHGALVFRVPDADEQHTREDQEERGGNQESVHVASALEPSGTGASAATARWR